MSMEFLNWFTEHWVIGIVLITCAGWLIYTIGEAVGLARGK